MGTMKQRKEPVNIIDRLLSERDSQFSNFNDKIQRLRHGHSNSSFKDQRRSGAALHETQAYHSNTSKPKLLKGNDINWGKQRFVLSAKNQDLRRDSHALLKAVSKKPDQNKATQLLANDSSPLEIRRQKQSYSFLACNTNQKMKLLHNQRALEEMSEHATHIASARQRPNRMHSVATEDSNWKHQPTRKQLNGSR